MVYSLLQVQIRPWYIADSYHSVDTSIPIDPRKAVFVGGVPRPLKASELAEVMTKKYGNVTFVAIAPDRNWKYPKGRKNMNRCMQFLFRSDSQVLASVCMTSCTAFICMIIFFTYLVLLLWVQCVDDEISLLVPHAGSACVVFSSHVSFIAAVSEEFMQLNYEALDKKVWIKLLLS